MTRGVCVCLCGAALAAALALRLASLDARPVHHDEANQAVRFGALLETGQYRYDRHDHHGPTLYYLTLPAAWLRGQWTLASLDETTIRLVPALFGAGLVLLIPLMAGGLGRTAVAMASVLAAVSPALTYYSRFYIQESLLAFFALGFLVLLGRHATRPGWSTAIGAGLFAGLALATKETSLIFLVVAPAACAVARRWAGIGRPPSQGPRRAVAGVAVGAGVAALFYSSLLSNPSGLVEAIGAVRVYLDRGVTPAAHAQPWHYYLGLLAWSSEGGLVWTEALILVLALAGSAAAVRGDGPGSDGQADVASQRFWSRYVALSALAATAIYSAIPYKTPWNLVPFHVLLIGLAGIGVAAILDRARSRRARVLVCVALAAGIVHLGVQSWRASVGYPADERNPYVYAQTSTDYLRLARRIDDLAAVHADGRAMLVRVVAKPHEQWPFPWYARRLTRVGYWTDPNEVDRLDDAAVVVASQEHADAVGRALGDRYVSEFYGLRPGVLLTLFIERAVWERFLDRRATSPGRTGWSDGDPRRRPAPWRPRASRA